MIRHAFVTGSGCLVALAAGMAFAAGQIDHVSGGIGVAEQQQLEARQGEFNLKLVFCLKEGNYVSDVDVAVMDAKGQTVVADRAGGPFFMARLPSGQYTIAATYEGRTVNRKVQVGGKGLRTEYLRWPSNPETDYPLSRWQDSEEPLKTSDRRS